MRDVEVERRWWEKRRIRPELGFLGGLWEIRALGRNWVLSLSQLLTRDNVPCTITGAGDAGLFASKCT